MNQEIFQVLIASIIIPVISIVYINTLSLRGIDECLSESLYKFLNITKGLAFMVFLIAPISIGYYFNIFFDYKYYATFLVLSYGIFFNLLFIFLLEIVVFLNKSNERVNIKAFTVLFKINVFAGYLGMFIVILIVFSELSNV